MFVTAVEPQDYDKGKPTVDGTAVRSLRPKPPTPAYNDQAYSVIFGLHIAGVAVLAFWKGIPTIQASIRDHQASANQESDDNLGFSLAAIALLAIGAGALSFVWLRLLLAFPESMIRIALWSNVVLTVVFAIATFAASPFAAILFIIFAAFSVCYIFAVRNRIGFASANLKVACAAVHEHAAVFLLAIVLLVAQLGWLILWALSAVGVYQLILDANPNCETEDQSDSNSRQQLCGGAGAYAALFFLLVSVYWGQQVLQNILTSSTAGVVGTWWYHPQAKNATLGAVRRTMTTSFGSICFGSLLIAILRAMRAMANMAMKKAQEDGNGALACFACVIECILDMLASIMEYINQWAYVYVGIYGFDFRTSGKAVIDLFRNRGWTAVINDDLTSTALGFGAFGVGIVMCCVGLLLAHLAPASWFSSLGSPYAVLGLTGFIAGVSMGMTLAQVVVASLHTVFVCFAEDPNALSQNHSREYQALVDGWRRFHGDALSSAFGMGV